MPLFRRSLCVPFALVVTVVLVMSGCSQSVVGPEGSVGPSDDTVVRSDDGRVTIEVPADAVNGDGVLAVEPVTDPADGADGWSITLDGADLTGTATIRFTIDDLEEGEPIPLITYAAESGGPRTPVSDVVLDGNQVVVTTTHFSDWFLTRWRDIGNRAIDDMKRSLDTLAAAGNGSPPECAGEATIRDDGFSITSDSGQRVYWCLGRENGEPVLKVVNARGYGVSAEYTPGLTVATSDREDFIATLAQLLKSPPSTRANDVELLASGNRIEFTVAESGRASDGVMIQPDPGAYLLTAAEFAASTYAMVLKPVGGEAAETALRTALVGQGCLSSMTGLAVTEKAGSDAGFDLFRAALDVALGCAELAVKEADLGPIIADWVQPIIWTVGGVRTAAMGLLGAAETAFDPSGYRIVINRPTQIVNVTAVDGLGDPLPGWEASGTQAANPISLDCTYSQPAASAVGSDIIRGCGSTADSANTCWVHSDRMTLTCAMNVWDQTYVGYRSTEPLAPSPPADAPIPEWIELEDGAHCTLAHGGSWGARTDGFGVGYACGDADYLVLHDVANDVLIDSSEPTWTVKVGDLGSPGQSFPPPTELGVVRAYFAASP